MQSTRSIEVISPILPNDKAFHLSKQQIAELKHQFILKPASATPVDSVAVEQQTAMIAHDMRSPLSVILSVLKACQKMPLPQLEQARIVLALEEAERLKRMADKILAHSRSPREPTELWQEFRLMDLIHEVIQLSIDSTVVGDRRIILKPGSIDGLVKGDRDKLKQVFLNLLMNACEAVDSGDIVTVQIQLEAHTQQLSIQVHNGGKPIPLHLISGLGHQPITTKSSGHGLGLMIVKDIIDAHAGTLEIHSSEHEGTMVRVLLPMIQGRSAVSPSGASVVESSPAPGFNSPPVRSYGLSTREIEVLQLLVEGGTNQEIAQMLCISVNTVKVYIRSLMSKLGVEGRTQIVVKAFRSGLVH